MHEPKPKGGDSLQPSADANTADWRKAGAPGGAGYGTARAMAALYQMMLNGGELNGTRILSPRMLQYAIRNHTGDRADEFMGMPMHRGARAPPARARPRTCVASAASPARAPSATAASAHPIAGAIPTRACPSPTSPTTASPTRGTPNASTWSRTSSTQQFLTAGHWLEARHSSFPPAKTPTRRGRNWPVIVFRTASVPLAQGMSERDARGPEEHEHLLLIVARLLMSWTEDMTRHWSCSPAAALALVNETGGESLGARLYDG